MSLIRPESLAITADNVDRADFFGDAIKGLALEDWSR